MKFITSLGMICAISLFSSCGTFGSDFMSTLTELMVGTYPSAAQPTGTYYQASQPTTTPGTQNVNAGSNGGVYIGDRYVNLTAYGASTEGLLINSTGIVGGATDIGGYSGSTSSASTNSTSTTTKSTSSPKVCSICGGTGTVKRSSHVTSYGVDASKKRCSTCGEMMMSPGHYHITCTNCHGTGKTK